MKVEKIKWLGEFVWHNGYEKLTIPQYYNTTIRISGNFEMPCGNGYHFLEMILRFHMKICCCVSFIQGVI